MSNVSELLSEEEQENRQCIYCCKSIKGHKRCKHCGILLHEEIYKCECDKPHSLTIDGKYCIDCERVDILEINED